MTDQNEDILKGLSEGTGFNFDASEYEGKRIAIDKVEFIKIKVDRDKDWNYVKDLQREAPAVRVSTIVVAVVPSSKGDVEIRASRSFFLKEETQKDGTIKYTWGPKSDLKAFMIKQKVNSPAELKGTMVTLTSRPVGDRNFIDFVAK
jgi:hypothetical protein